MGVPDYTYVNIPTGQHLAVLCPQELILDQAHQDPTNNDIEDRNYLIDLRDKYIMKASKNNPEVFHEIMIEYFRRMESYQRQEQPNNAYYDHSSIQSLNLFFDIMREAYHVLQIGLMAKLQAENA